MMSQGPIIPSNVVLSDAHNVVQARHELHRATDFGGPEQLADWARKWGEAAVAAGELAANGAGEFDGFVAPAGLHRAAEIAESLVAILAKEPLDLELARRRAGELLRKINVVVEAFEE